MRPICPSQGVKCHEPVDGDHATSGLRSCSEEHRFLRHSVAIDGSGGLQVVDKQQAGFGDDVNEAVLVAHLHSHGEVVSKLVGEEELRLTLHRGSACAKGACTSLQRLLLLRH